MKPWERALQREPMCAFVEAVVDGFSPIDKHICRLARAAQTMRARHDWCHVGDQSVRGEVRYYKGPVMHVEEAEAVAGELVWT